MFILSAEVMANKIRQDLHIKGIEILGNELRLSQYADDTNLFCAELASVEKDLEIVDNFVTLAGLKLIRKKQKRSGWEKGGNSKTNPLQLKWLHIPVKILGIHVSYDEKGNNQLNFNHKLQKRDIWRARDLTLFEIMKSVALSRLVYSA